MMAPNSNPDRPVSGFVFPPVQPFCTGFFREKPEAVGFPVEEYYEFDRNCLN